MGRISQTSINQIIAASDIVQVISGYIPLKRAGSGFKGCCPFHQEKTPSFNVSPSRQIFKCFGCGESGGVVSFVMKYENLSYQEGLRRLAERAGITIQEEQDSPQQQAEIRLRKRLLEMHKQAAEWMHKLLLEAPEAAAAREYASKRGYDRQTMLEWKMGWAPQRRSDFVDWARKAGYSLNELLASGMFQLREENNPRGGVRPRFCQRLMFPICNDYGEIIAFSGRIIDPTSPAPKYVNSAESHIFIKGQVIFGLHKARRFISKNDRIILCEGQLDAIACSKAGFAEAVAPLGTAFTSDQARLLKRFSSNILLCFDADKAGQAAMQRAFSELAQFDFNIKIINLPAGSDPDSIIQQQGSEAFAACLQQAKGYLDAYIDWQQDKNQLDSYDAKAQCARELLPMLALYNNNIERHAHALNVATRLGIDPKVYNSELSKLRSKKNAPSRATPNQSRSTAGNASAAPAELKVEAHKLSNLVRALLELALNSPEALQLLKANMAHLLEPLQQLEGGILALRLLGELPDYAGQPQVLDAYLHGRDPATKMTLQGLLGLANYADPLTACQDIMRAMGKDLLQKKQEQILAQLRQNNQTPERVAQLMGQLTSIQNKLRNC